MKKTILMTISMLAVFSVLAWVSANQLTNKWQTPQQDEIDLSVSSPVEMVEKEYKEYKYTTDIPYKDKNKYYNISDYKNGMISYSEATSIAGNLIETALPFIDVDNIVFSVGVIKNSGSNNEEFLIFYSEENADNLVWCVGCSVDAFTGEIMWVSCYRHLCESEDEEIHSLVEEAKLNPEEYLMKKSLKDVSAMGYEEIIYNNIVLSQGDSGSVSCDVSIEAKMNKRTDMIKFNYNYGTDDDSTFEYINYKSMVYQGIN